MYSLGIDVAGDAEFVDWARTRDVDAPTTVDTSGSVPALVGAAPDGTLRVSAGGRPLEHVASGFLGRLGASEPVIVGTTPYGVEALLAAVLDEVIRVNVTELGDTPVALGLVHDDGLDRFHCSLLVEAARVAGVSPDHVVLVPRSAALAAAAEIDARVGTPSGAAGGAAAAAAALADEDEKRTGMVAPIGAGLAGAVAAAVVGARVLDAGTATASVAGVGPAGVALTAGPQGSGIAGGPTGTPLTGPAGRPIADGPQGSPLATAAKATRPRWVPAAVAGGLAAVVVTVAVVVVAARGDGETAASVPTSDPTRTASAPADSTTPSTINSAATTVAASPVEPIPTTDPLEASTSLPPTTEPTTTEPTFDLTALAGAWETVCEPFLAGDGASTGRWEFETTSGNTMDVTVSGVDYTTTDCSGDGTVLDMQMRMTFRVVGTAPIAGRDAFVGVTDRFGVMAVAVAADQLSIGVGGDELPTSFEPELEAVRR